MADKPEEDGSYDFAEPTPAPAPEPRLPPMERVGKPDVPLKDDVKREGSASKPTPGPVSESAAEVLTHTCLHCGYSYMGKRKPRCPECASPAEGAADLLQFANAGWVRTMSLGILLMVPGILLHIAGCVFNRMDMAAGAEAGPELAHAKGWAHLVGAILMVIGVTLATRKEPDTAGKGMGVAFWARVFSLAALCVWVMAAGYALDKFHVEPGNRVHIKKMLTLAALVPQGVMCVMLAIYCARLAGRIPSDTLAWHTSTTGSLAGAVCAFLIFAIGLEFDRGYFMVFFVVSYPPIAMMLIILLWAMITLIRLGLELRVSAAAGERIAEIRMRRQAQQKQGKRDDGAGSPLGL